MNLGVTEAKFYCPEVAKEIFRQLDDTPML